MTEPKGEYTRVSFLFKKYLNGSCSNDEAAEIVAFLEDPANDDVLMNEVITEWCLFNSEHKDNLIPTESKIIMDRILDRLHHQINLKEEENARNYSVNKFFTFFSKIAAVLIIPLFVYAIYLTSKTTHSMLFKATAVVWQTVKTPTGMQTDFLLPDGSHIWLNSGSVLKYPVPFTTDKRQVELSGEAFFDVVKDPSHPFLVKAGKMNIEVKGTRFNVINYPNEMRTELILERGRVRLFSGNYEDNNTVTNIIPGEHVVLDNSQNKLEVSKVDVDKYTAWKEGMLIFKDDPMDEVVRKLNRWFNVDIILQSPELKEYVYTATFKDETLTQILELLKISAPVKYNITERKQLDDHSYSKRKIIITKQK